MKIKIPAKTFILVILVSVVTGVVYLRSNTYVPVEQIEVNARKFHNIESNWQVVKDTNSNISAMIFFSEEKKDFSYSIYVYHNGFLKGYAPRIGGKIDEIRNSCAKFVFNEIDSVAFLSMNEQKIYKVEIDDGDNVTTVSLNASKPFALVFSSNVGNITFYNENEEIIIPIQRNIRE